MSSKSITKVYHNKKKYKTVIRKRYHQKKTYNVDNTSSNKDTGNQYNSQMYH